MKSTRNSSPSKADVENGGRGNFARIESGILGLFLCLLGIGAVTEGLSLQIGSATRMGPGYFPLLIGASLILLGLTIGLLPSRKFVSWSWTACIRGAISFIAVILAIASFGFLLERGGLLISTVAAVLISTAPVSAMSLIERLILAGVLALGSYLVFVYALGVSMPGFTFNW